MADLNALYDALRQAHAAGDTQGATRLAQYIREVTAEAPPVEAKQAPMSLSDTLLSAAQGAVGATKSTIEGITGAGSGIGESLEGAQKWLGGQMTPERQAEQQRRALMEKEAARTGKPLEEIAAGLGGIKEAPLQTIAQGVGSAAPTVLLGMGAAALGATLGAPVALAAAVGIGTKYLIGAIQGAGEVKGTIYDAVREQLEADKVPPAEAKRQAAAAQDYLGKNWDVIAQGAGLGAGAGGTGAESELLKRFSKPVAQRIAANAAAKKSAGREFLEATGVESLGEGAQGGQQQYAENVALTREGYARDAMAGVYGAAARDAAMGALTGGAIHPFTGGRRAEVAPGETPLPTVPTEPGTQGALFAPGEAPVPRQPELDMFGEPVTRAPEAPAAATATPGVPAGQEDLGLDFQREYADMVQERERLKQVAQTPEVKARVAELGEQLALYTQSDIESIRAQQEGQAAAAAEDAKARKKFPALTGAPDLMNMPDAVKARTQAELFPGEDLGMPPMPEAPTTEPTLRAAKEKAPLQYKLPLRSVREGRTPNREFPMPEQLAPLTMQDVLDVNIPLRKGMQPWFEQNIVGKTLPEIQALVKRTPALIEGPSQQAKILRELLAPQPAPFKEAPRVEPTITETPAVEQRIEPGAGEPSMGVPSEPTPAERVQPGAGVSPTPEAPVTPDGLGLVPAGRPAVPGAAPQGAEPTAVTARDLQTQIRALSDQQLELLDSAGRKPRMGSTREKQWQELDAQMARLRRQWDVVDRKERATPPVAVAETPAEEAARLAEAEAVRRQMEALEKAPPKRAAPAPTAAPAPQAEKVTPTEIPEKLREPVGTTELGGEGTILRGPQGMLFPMSKREETEYAKAKEAEDARKEDVIPSPAADTRQMELVFPPDEEAMVQAIDGKTILEAANWAANNLPDVDQRMIAKRVAATLRELQAVGVIMGPVKITPAGQQLASGARGTSGLKPGPNGMPSTVRITLNHPSNGDQSGTTPEILLHELIHTATMGALSVGNRKSAANTRVGKTVSELYDVAKAVFDHVDAKHARGETLNAVEQQLRSNYMRDVDEVLAWTMTNRDMQAYMESVPYKNSNLWTKFVEAVRNVLGLTAKADTALSEILRIGGVLTELTTTELQATSTATGKQFALAPGTEALIESMGPLDAQEKSRWRMLIDGFKTQDEVNYAVKFRTQVADAAATIEHRLREQFDGKVRDSLGKLNPMGLYRQAQDHAKLLLEYFQQGSLIKDPSSGLWNVGTKAGVRPPAAVYELIDRWAAKNGYSRERGTQIASRVLEGVRLDAMRTANKTEGTSFALHLKDNEIDQLVREYKADPDLQAMSKAMDEPRLAMIDNMVAVGRLSPEQGKAWKEVAGYVPFDRIEDFAENFSKIKKISNKGLAQVGKLPELKGSFNRPVGNVFDNYINTLGWMVGQTMKTDGTVLTLRSLEDIGQAKFLGRSPQGKANTVGAYVKGEMMYWELPSKYDLMAFKDLNPPKAGWLRALGRFSDVLRKSVTVLPPFALKQVTDDVQRAIMTSGVKNPGALLRMSLTNFPKLALAELRGIQHPMVREFGAMGLTGEYDFQQGKPAISLLKDLKYKPRGKFETLIHRLDGITRASDLSVRKAIYDQTMKESSGDQLLAQTRAREFINFRRRGAADFVGAMVTTIPFFNAYIQGMDVLYRAASGKDSSSSIGRAHARRMFWSRAAVVTMLSSLYAMGAGDDEDYKDMDLRTRDGNWILPGVGKLPVPGELGALFKVIPERIVEYMKRQGTPEDQTAWEATRTALTYMFEQYIGRATPVPQAVKPLMEAWANKSFLTGRELEGIYQKQQDPSMRRSAQTSELAIAIANFSRDSVGVEVSPIQIDNALRGYFGSTAALLTATTDSLLNPTRVDRPLHKWALVSNYMYDPVGTRRMTEFYEEREKVGRANTTLNELMKTDMDRAAAYAESHADELMLESAMNSTLEQLENTRAYRKFLNSPDGAKSMPATEREASLKEVKQMELDMVGWLREAKVAVRQ